MSRSQAKPWGRLQLYFSFNHHIKDDASAYGNALANRGVHRCFSPEVRQLWSAFRMSSGCLKVSLERAPTAGSVGDRIQTSLVMPSVYQLINCPMRPLDGLKLGDLWRSRGLAGISAGRKIPGFDRPVVVLPSDVENQNAKRAAFVFADGHFSSPSCGGILA